MRVYADLEFYYETYGGVKLSNEAELKRWIMRATSEIRHYTFGRIDQMENIPEEAQMCCCEVAERLYVADKAKSENGAILQSYSNDGESATYAVADISEDAVKKEVYDIIHRWLSLTGLMYCGVGNYESEL